MHKRFKHYRRYSIFPNIIILTPTDWSAPVCNLNELAHFLFLLHIIIQMLLVYLGITQRRLQLKKKWKKACLFDAQFALRLRGQGGSVCLYEITNLDKHNNLSGKARHWTMLAKYNAAAS